MQTAAAIHAPMAALRVAPCSRSTPAAAGLAAAASMRRSVARPARAARPAIQAFQGFEQQTERATVPVTFVMNHQVHFAQQVVLVGSLPEVGAWALEGGVKLSWSEGHAWTATVELPAGAELEYKFVVIDKRHGAFWETCLNRQLSVASSSAQLEYQYQWEAAFPAAPAVPAVPAVPASIASTTAQSANQGASEAAAALTQILSSVEEEEQAGCEAVAAVAAATGAALAAETSAVLKALAPAAAAAAAAALASTPYKEEEQEAEAAEEVAEEDTAVAAAPARSARKAGSRRGAALVKLSPQAEAEVEAVIAAGEAAVVERQQSPVPMAHLANAVKGHGRPAVARTASMGFAPVKPAASHKPVGAATKPASKRPSFRPKLAAPSPKPAAPEPAAPAATPFFPPSAAAAAPKSSKAGGAKSGKGASGAPSSPALDAGAGKTFSPEQLAFLERSGKL